MLEYKKKSYKKEKIILIFLIIIVIGINYPILDKAVENLLIESETANVTRIIDGDTIEINHNESVRLLGINTPERGEYFYEQAKEFLEKKVLNKQVKIVYEKQKYDKYYRKLGYIYLNEKNINLEIVEKGYGNFYFPSGKTASYSKFLKAWENCLEQEINLCEKSVSNCSKCIKLKELNIENQILILENICNFNCDLTGWMIKDQGRKKYVFGNFILNSKKEIKIGKNDFEEEYVWTKGTDSLFLRDSLGKHILWKNY